MIALVALSGQAFAANYAAVGACTPPNPVTPAHTYATIQLAVTSSAPGTVIQICPGIYPEQVVVTKRLTLTGVPSTTQDAAVIVPPITGLVANTVDLDNPSLPIAAQILVQNTFASSVTINNLTVDGTGNLVATCGLDLDGILFQNASGAVSHVAVRNQVPVAGFGGCQIGLGIYVQTGIGFTSKVAVSNSSVHNYNKNGITGNDVGTTLNLTGNYIQGAGAIDYIAQNGIQLAYGATGKIVSETVIDNSYVGPVDAAADILLYDTSVNGGVAVTSNILGNSQYPIVLYTLGTDGANVGDGVVITGNHIFGGASFDAIDVCTNGNTVNGNTIFDSAESAIHLDGSCGGTGKNNTATGNTIVESACAGIIDDWSGTGGNNYSADTYYTVPFPVAGSAGSCPFVTGLAHAKGKRKFSPVGLAQ